LVNRFIRRTTSRLLWPATVKNTAPKTIFKFRSRMIYLLGSSGYANQPLLACKGVPFRNLRRGEVDYILPGRLKVELKRERPEFLINAAGYTGGC
jgi:hypothetical protein